jgi:hypothetical protein
MCDKNLLRFTALRDLTLELGDNNMHRFSQRLSRLSQMTQLRALAIEFLPGRQITPPPSSWISGLSALTMLALPSLLTATTDWHLLPCLRDLRLAGRYQTLPSETAFGWSNLQQLRLTAFHCPDAVWMQLTQLRKLTLGMLEGEIPVQLLQGPGATVTSLSVFCIDLFTNRHLQAFTQLRRLYSLECREITNSETLCVLHTMTQLTELYVPRLYYLFLRDRDDAQETLAQALPLLKTPCFGNAKTCSGMKSHCKGRHFLG